MKPWILKKNLTLVRLVLRLFSMSMKRKRDIGFPYLGSDYG